MSKQATFAVLFLVLLFIFIPGGGVSAQAPEFEGPIVECGRGDAGGPFSCQACELVTLSQNVINFIIFLATVIAILMFVYAGFLYITAAGDPGKITKAHGIFWAVFVGFIIVLSSWLFISFLMSSFLRTSFQPWSGILCEFSNTGNNPGNSNAPGYNPPPDDSGDGDIVVAPPPVTKNICYAITEKFLKLNSSGEWEECTESTSGCSRKRVAITGTTYTDNSECSISCSGGGVCSDPTSLTSGNPTILIDPTITGVFEPSGDTRTAAEKAADEEAVRQEFEDEDLGISVNKGPCDVNEAWDEHPGGCTDVSLMTDDTKEAVFYHADLCMDFNGSKCNFVITGGSELGHTGGTDAGTHGGGWKFDVRPTGQINNYITNNSDQFQLTTINGRTGYQDVNTGDFWVLEDEGTSNEHWDVLVNQ